MTELMPWEVVLPTDFVELPVHRFSSRSGKTSGHVVREIVDKYGNWDVTCICPAGRFAAWRGGCYRMIEIRHQHFEQLNGG